MAPASTVEVAIIGAGPAGTAAAISLGASGVDVVLIDKTSFPRDKTCGDGLTAAALRLLKTIGVSPHDLPSWTRIDRAVIHGPDGATVDLDLPDDGPMYAAVARRSELDHRLVDIATSAGASLLHEDVVRITRADDHVAVDCSDGSRITAGHAVVATGASSAPVMEDRKGNGHEVRGAELFGTRVYLKNTTALPSHVHVWFLHGILPGYAWLFPLRDGAANIGVVVHGADGARRGAVQATRHFLSSDTLGRIAGAAIEPTDRVRSWPIPARLARRRSSGRVLFAGDAAGVADPMTGEGIAQALQSGLLAAKAIAKATRGIDAATRYQIMSGAAFRSNHLASRVALPLLRRPATTRAAIRLMGSGSKRRSYAARWMWEDVPRSAFISPLAFARSLSGPHGAVFEG